MTTAVDRNTVWFRVSRVVGRSDAATNGAWMISRRTPANLLDSRPHGWWGGDFAAKDEAIAHGEAKGWVLVANWAQAKAQAQPYWAEQQAGAARSQAAREGLVQVRVDSVVRWVTPAIAESLLLLLRTDDEYGTVRELRGGIVV